MNFSVQGTYVLLPVENLDSAKRYNECQANFACEITGPDARACVTAVAHDVSEIEEVDSSTFRVHKPTEHLARYVRDSVKGWADCDSSRQVSAISICTDHTVQQARDACSAELNGTGSHGSPFMGGVAFECGGKPAQLLFAEDGTFISLSVGDNHGTESPSRADLQFDLAKAKEEIRDLKRLLQEPPKKVSAPAKGEPAPKSKPAPKRTSAKKPAARSGSKKTKSS